MHIVDPPKDNKSLHLHYVIHIALRGKFTDGRQPTSSEFWLIHNGYGLPLILDELPGHIRIFVMCMLSKVQTSALRSIMI